MTITPEKLTNIIEAAIMSVGQPMTIDQLIKLFGDDEVPSRDEIREAIKLIQHNYENRGVELVEVSSGYRIQARQDFAPWVSRLWEEKPPRYSRALLETLVLVAYRQPITRGEIENIRGVSVSTNIIKTLQERDWVRVVGHRDVPGKPAIYATTKTFLDYFNLKSLDELPTLAEIRDLDKISAELGLEAVPEQGGDEADYEESTQQENSQQEISTAPSENKRAIDQKNEIQSSHEANDYQSADDLDYDSQQAMEIEAQEGDVEPDEIRRELEIVDDGIEKVEEDLDEEFEDIAEILDEVEKEVNEIEEEQQSQSESIDLSQTYENGIDSEQQYKVSTTDSSHHYEHTDDIAAYDEKENETIDIDNSEEKQELKAVEFDNTIENS